MSDYRGVVVVKLLSTTETLDLIENLCNLLAEKEQEIFRLTGVRNDYSNQTSSANPEKDHRFTRYMDSSWLGGRLV